MLIFPCSGIINNDFRVRAGNALVIMAYTWDELNPEYLIGTYDRAGSHHNTRSGQDVTAATENDKLWDFNYWGGYTGTFWITK